MRSWLNRARLRLSTLLFMPLAFGLSACMTTPAVNLYAPACFTTMVSATKLSDPTPHAALPAATVGGWVDFGNREAGQLDKANADKTAIAGIGRTCDKWLSEAKEKAEAKPWYRRIF